MMARRLHECTNDTHMNTINCDAYKNRLGKRDKNSDSSKSGQSVKCSRDRSGSRPRTMNHLATTLVAGATCFNPKCRNTKQQNTALMKANTAPPSNYLHEDELPENTTAMVQVLVKANNNKPDKGESWGKFLKTQKQNEAKSSFSNFDPLRTLHFLTKELHSKVQSELPNNRNLKQLVLELEHTLNRIPPEVGSTINLEKERSKSKERFTGRSRSYVRSIKETDSERSVKPKIIRNEKSCQTSDKLSQHESQKLQKQMEVSTMQLEASCKQMEVLCNRLQTEKTELEQLLQSEKDNVKVLRKELDQMQLEKTELSNARIKELEQERDELTNQVNKLTAIVETQTVPTSTELKSLIQELRLQKTSAEQECLSLRHKLTLSNMEKEKYMAILSIRDRQINEIRTEMTQLQEVVNEQLIELQTGIGFGSVPTSQSSVLEHGSWQALNKEMGDNILRLNTAPSSINTTDTVHQIFVKEKIPSSSFRELPSGDSSGTSSVLHEMQENLLLNNKKAGFYETLTPTKDLPVLDTNGMLKTIPESQTDLDGMSKTKELFEELKKQAYSIKVPLIPGNGNKTNINFLSSEESLQK